MFSARWLPEALEQYEALKQAALQARQTREAVEKSKSSKQEGLFKQVHKCLTNLLNNPKHPSLATHAYSSLPHPYDPNAQVFEAYVQNQSPGAYRLFWCYGPARGEITILAITPHP